MQALFSLKLGNEWLISLSGCWSSKSKGDYLRILGRVIWYQNHFPTNKNLVWGAYIDQLFMPDNFAFMGRKNVISKKGPKTDLSGNFLEFLLKKNSCEIDSMGSSVLHIL